MRLFLCAIALAALGGCDQGRGPDPATHHSGRYQGIGTYPAGRLWPYQQPGQTRDAAAATIDDDEQIVVTVDSQTGEVRQCGNLSGRCIVTNPWRDANGAGTRLTAHAIDLDSENQAVSNEAQPARR